MAPVARMMAETMSVICTMGHWKPLVEKRNVVGKRKEGTTPEVKWVSLSLREGRGNVEWLVSGAG